MSFATGVGASLTGTVVWTSKKYALRLLSRMLFWTSRNIEGEWQTAFAKDGRLHEEYAEVAQLGPFVRGRIGYHDKERWYLFSGTIREGILVGRYEITGSQSALDRGSFTLAGNRCGDLSILEGCYAWTDDDTNRPRADCYVWVKDGFTKLTDRVTTGASGIHGTGVFAAREFNQDDVLGYFEGASVEIGTDFSLNLEHRQVEPTGKLRHLNHSCSPNAHFRDRWLTANGRIDKGHEITIDYLATETMLTQPFGCKCGSSNCRKEITIQEQPTEPCTPTK